MSWFQICLFQEECRSDTKIEVMVKKLWPKQKISQIFRPFVSILGQYFNWLEKPFRISYCLISLSLEKLGTQRYLKGSISEHLHKNLRPNLGNWLSGEWLTFSYKEQLFNLHISQQYLPQVINCGHMGSFYNLLFLKILKFWPIFFYFKVKQKQAQNLCIDASFEQR